MYLLHNGQRKKMDDVQIHLTNRSFLYGDGFFDTLRVEKRRIPWLHLHFERWTKSCEAMGIESPFQENEWGTWIQSLITTDSARVRTHLWTGEGVNYGNRGKVETLVQVFPWEKQRDQTWVGGLVLDEHLPKGKYQWMKLNSSFFYAQVEKKVFDRGWDEALLMNQDEELVEGCHSALFWKRQGQWFTHPNGADGIWSTAKAAALRWGTPEGESVTEGRLPISEIKSVSEWAMGNALNPWIPFSLLEV